MEKKLIILIVLIVLIVLFVWLSVLTKNQNLEQKKETTTYEIEENLNKEIITTSTNLTTTSTSSIEEIEKNLESINETEIEKEFQLIEENLKNF